MTNLLVHMIALENYVFFTIPIIWYPISFTAWSELGEENQLSKSTYFAGIPAFLACFRSSRRHNCYCYIFQNLSLPDTWKWYPVVPLEFMSKLLNSFIASSTFDALSRIILIPDVVVIGTFPVFWWTVLSGITSTTTANPHSFMPSTWTNGFASSGILSLILLPDYVRKVYYRYWFITAFGGAFEN